MTAQNHKGKIALITGANKGIGYELARQLGKEGVTVLIAARNAELGGVAADKLKAEGTDAYFIELDVTKPDSIAKAAETVRTRYGRLDILVNNAGVTDKGDGPPSTIDPEAVRRVLDVNFFGVLAVTQAMLPLVRNSAAGRIVMLSSGLGSLTWNADPKWPFASFKPLGYNGSKAILNMMTVQLAWELRDTAIKVNTVNPGYTATDMNDSRGTQTPEEGAAEAFLLNPQPLTARTAHEWGVVAEVVPNGTAVSRARELAELYMKAPEVTRRNTRVHFIQPLKERIVREVGYGLALEGASAADLVKSMQAKSEPVAHKKQSA